MIDWRCSFLSLNQEDCASSVWILGKSASNSILPSLCHVVVNFNLSWRLARILEILHTILNFLHQSLSFLFEFLREENTPFVKFRASKKRCDCSIKVSLFGELDCLLVSNEDLTSIQLSTFKFKWVCVQSHLPFCHQSFAFLMIQQCVKECLNSLEFLFSICKEDVFAFLCILDLEVIIDSSQHACLRNEVDFLLLSSSFIYVNKHWLVHIFHIKSILLFVVVLVSDFSSGSFLIQSEGLHWVHVIVNVFNSVNSLIVSCHDSSVKQLLCNCFLHVSASSFQISHHIKGSLLHDEFVCGVHIEQHSRLKG